MFDQLKKEIERQRLLINEEVTLDYVCGKESRTRVSLIDPMLRALGWNVANPSQVKLEFECGGNLLDYVLMGADGTPWAGIEAKKLNEDLGIHIGKLKADALALQNRFGAEYYILTNGNLWRLYHGIAATENDTQEQKVFEVSIFDSQTGECALALSQLWRPDFRIVPPVPAGHVRFWPTTRTPVTEGWFRLSDWENRGLGKKPKAHIRFSDGKECELKNWYQLVEHTANWLFRVPSVCIDKPILSRNGKRYMISKEETHPNGKQFKAPKELAQAPWKFDKQNGAIGHLSDAIELLTQCKQDPDDVLVSTIPDRSMVLHRRPRR